MTQPEFDSSPLQPDASPDAASRARGLATRGSLDAQPASGLCVSPFAVARPFLVAEAARMALPVGRDDWHHVTEVNVGTLTAGERRRLTYEWQRIAATQHASIAAFARFTLQLLALGAPPMLLRGAQQAMSDETEHAMLAYGIASAYAGRAVGPGALDVSGCVANTDAWSVLINTLIEGCIGETVAGLEAVEGLASVRDPAVVAVLQKIARDEQKHGELAWRFVRWLLSREPALGQRLRSVVDEQVVLTRAAIEGTERDPASDWLMRHGLLSDLRRCSLRLQVLDDVVGPSLNALCASVGHAAA